MASYCSKECQKSHWEYHAVYCSTIVDLVKCEKEKIYGNRTVRQKQMDFKTKRKMMKLVGDKPMLNCQLGGKSFEMLWDTGSMISLVDRSWVRRNFPDEKIHSVTEFMEDELNVRAANATSISLDGVVLLEFGLKGGGDGFIVPLLVASDDMAEPILGYNVIEHLVLDGSKDQHAALKSALRGKKNFEIEPLTALITEKASNPSHLAEVKASDEVTIPAGCRTRIKCRVKVQGDNTDETVYFSPVITENDDDLTFLETVSQLKQGRTNSVVVEVLNQSKVQKVLRKGRVIGSVHAVSAVIPLMKLVDEGIDGKTKDVEVERVGVQIEQEEQEEQQEASRTTVGDNIKWDLLHLNDEQRRSLEKLLIKMKEVFSKNDADIGNIKEFQMPINVVDDVPVTAAYRRIPPHLYHEVKKYIEDLVTNGWVRESNSNYCSPIVCVRKKDGGMRMCIDYRKLNAKTVADMQPIPRIQDIIDSLGGQNWFTTLDLSKAYHQGYIDEKSRHLTAFVTPWTIYEWIRIPFGLRNAPPAFQRYINQVLGDLKGLVCEPYLDDILCYGQSFEEHIANLEKVLGRLKSRGIKLRADKCVFAKREVRYLGRLLSGNGYRPDPTDTVALEKFRVQPKTVGELRSLLGFFGYYRCYIKDFSKRVKPLYDLLKGKEDVKVDSSIRSKKSGKKSGQNYNSKARIDWSDRHQRIIEELIEYLKSPEVIAYPNFDLPFFVTCDASSEGLGAVLYQRQGGVNRVISYASRTLSESEKSYHLHSGKLEFLALKWAITERFSDYLRYGPPFIVYTDNNPLTYVLTSAKLNAVGQRWVNDLADYQFTIKYRPGKANTDADYLSRRPLNCEEWRSWYTETVEMQNVCAVMAGAGNGSKVVAVGSCGATVDSLVLKPEGEVVKVSVEDLYKEQMEDKVIGVVYNAVLSGKRPTRKEWLNWSHDSKVAMKNFGKLLLKGGVLMRKTARHMQLVLPERFHHLVYVELHEKLGHLGVEKVVELAQQRFYWPKMAAHIKNYIQKKCRCIVNKRPNKSEKAPLVPIQATYPFQIVSIDYLHLDKCKGGYQYVMMVTDHFTRFCQMYATKTKGSKPAADKLFNEFVVQFGYPERIHHDQGPEFNSNLFKELHRLTGIGSSNTTPYHPMGDGQVERLNRTAINMLKSLSGEAKKDWRRYLPKMAFAYNSTINKTTGFSPFYLLFGRESKLPIDLVFLEVRDEHRLQKKSHEQFVKEWHQTMKEAVQVARKNVNKSAQYNKQYYDKKAKAVEMKVGDMVLNKNDREKGGTGKLKSYWEEAIFEVLEKKADLPVYKIRNVKKNNDIRVVHRNNLMKCEELPTNVFEERSVTNRKSKPKRGSGKKGELKVDMETENEDVESEEEVDEVAVIIHETVVEQEELENVATRPQDAFLGRGGVEPHVPQESSSSESEVDEVPQQEDVGRGNEGSEVNSDSSEGSPVPRQRPQRDRKKRRYLHMRTWVVFLF